MSEKEVNKQDKLLNNTKPSSDSGEILSIFDAKLSGSPIKLNLKPITGGLGFQDRVSKGVYTEQLEPLAGPSADAGAFDVGHEELDHGEVHVNSDGLSLDSSEVLRPILFHSGHDGLIKKRAKKSTESFFAIFIDLMLSLSGSILTLAFFMDFLGFNSIEDFFFEPTTSAFNFGAIFLAFYMSYKVLSRAFYGRSLGEWACRLQMGSFKDQQKFIYTFQVVLREVLSLATGLFLLPLASLLFGKDLGYYVSGLHVYLEKK